MENNMLLLLAAFAVLIAGVLMIWYAQSRNRKILDSMEKMLDGVMKGDFTESSFDETRMSRLESEMAHYLSASAISARNVEQEKDKIKTWIADISHQTKTPIANLLLYSELLTEEELSDSAREKVESVHSQAEKLQFLIEALVKLSRLENGIISLQPKENDVNLLLQEIKEQYQAKAEAKGLLLHVEGTESRAVFDPRWTAEALGNIVDSAIKYTREGSVTISVLSYEMFVRIDVTDTGVGISEEEQARIFTRFYRSQSAEGDGVGIGLFLAREITAGEGGYLKVHSTVGKGSVFSVFLPREQSSGQVS